MHTVRQMLAQGGVLALVSLIPSFTYAADTYAADPAAAGPTLMTLYNFAGGANGSAPETGLALGATGYYFGTTYTGGTAGLGSVYQMEPPSSPGGAWTQSTIYSFQGGADGAYPKSALVVGSSNILYGTTQYGGTYGFGTVFQLVPPVPPATNWTETVLYSFQGGSDGANPCGDLVITTTGLIYGTTTYGGTPGFGTVYQLTPPVPPATNWTEQQLYAFQGGPNASGPNDGANPMAGLLLQTVNTTTLLYGTTYQGGTLGWGTAFQLVAPSSPGGTWTENIAYNFTGLTDGGSPEARIYPGKAGAFYGTTFFAGSASACKIGGFPLGCGTVYQLTPPGTTGGAWTYTVLYTFNGIGSKGAHPSQAIALDNNGAIYLTTYSGGSNSDVCYGKGNYPGCGTIMRIKPPSTSGSPWTASVLHDFLGDTDGGSPTGVLRSTTGALYGTTVLGGNQGSGTIFELMP